LIFAPSNIFVDDVLGVIEEDVLEPDGKAGETLRVFGEHVTHVPHPHGFVVLRKFLPGLCFEGIHLVEHGMLLPS
jgi:hypothetical protein